MASMNITLNPDKTVKKKVRKKKQRIKEKRQLFVEINKAETTFNSVQKEPG